MTLMELDKIRLDAFREISSIATGNAATSLSSLLGQKVDITVPNIMMESIAKVPELLGGPEKIMTAIYFSVDGEISGNILMVFSSSETLRLIDILTGQKADKIEDINEMGISSLKELGNIVIGAYIRVLGDGLEMRISYSVPGFTYDMMGAILDEPLARLSLETKYAVIVESEFIIREKIYRGYLVLILAPKAVNSIIKALGSVEN